MKKAKLKYFLIPLLALTPLLPGMLEFHETDARPDTLSSKKNIETPKAMEAPRSVFIYEVSQRYYQKLQSLVMNSTPFAGGTIIMSLMLLFLLLFRVIRRPANIRAKQRYTLPLAKAGSGSSLKKTVSKELDHSFEQERWNLPGFQSLLSPFKKFNTKTMSASHFNPWEHFYKDPPGLDRSTALQFYRFPDFYNYIEGMSNIEAFVKEMLRSLAGYLRPCSASACLRDEKGQYHLVLQHSGNLFVSEKNAKLESPSWKNLIQFIEKGNYVVLGNGEELAFPLPSRLGPMGLLHFRRERPLEEPQILEEVWLKIRKYGERLFQACIYEQATVEAESTLFNGMRFQEDLRREIACRLEKTIPIQLILIQLHGKLNAAVMSFCGRLLRQTFPFPDRAYRIAENLCCILTTNPSQEETKKRLLDLLALIQKQYSIHACIGSAIPTLEISSPEEWFKQAQRTLAEIQG